MNHNQPQNPLDLQAEKASSDNDLRHLFVFSSIYSLPFGHGQHFGSEWDGVEDVVLGGWQMNGIFVAQSGTPVNVIQNGNNQNYPGLRPNLTGDPTLSKSQRTLNQYFDTAAFCAPNTGSDRKLSACEPRRIHHPHYHFYGDAGTQFGPWPWLRERRLFDLQDVPDQRSTSAADPFEFFNITNTPHFGNPGGDLRQASVWRNPTDDRQPANHSIRGEVSFLIRHG